MKSNHFGTVWKSLRTHTDRDADVEIPGSGAVWSPSSAQLTTRQSDQYLSVHGYSFIVTYWHKAGNVRHLGYLSGSNIVKEGLWRSRLIANSWSQKIYSILMVLSISIEQMTLNNIPPLFSLGWKKIRSNLIMLSTSIFTPWHRHKKHYSKLTSRGDCARVTTFYSKT